MTPTTIPEAAALKLAIAALKYGVGKIIHTVTSRTIDGLVKFASGFDSPLRWTLHMNELHARVKDMPFIYKEQDAKDLETDILNDFVDIHLERLDLETLDAVHLKATMRGPSLMDSHDRRKFLMLGNAGIGKTTFMRHTILRLIIHRMIPQLFGHERLIPFYVPLKNIDNDGPYPVIRYLLSTSPALRRSGLKSLTRLAEQQRLILFLDAYDECPLSAVTSNESHSYLREEINLMVAPGSFDRHEFFNPAYKRLYEHLRSCRLWLSSRKEFFMQFPIDFRHRVAQGVGPLSAQTAMATELRGVGSRRAELVNNIFSKYRKRSETYADLLNAEFFLQEIDAAQSDIVRLSYNPLFLTVMSFVYATEVIKAKSNRVRWGSTLRGVIMKCIDLLLYDLDEAKTLGFPTAARDAILNRRNKFKDEKLQFLKYFAYASIDKGISVFSKVSLADYARSFFQLHLDWPNANLILREIDRPRFTKLSFVDDLIFCGLFVTVDKGADGAIYDFPVRRFREVLALEYVESHRETNSLIDKIVARVDQAELLYVVFEMSNNCQDVIIRSIREHLIGGRDLWLGSVLLTCLERKPSRYDPTPVLQTWFLDSIKAEATFQLPGAVLSYFTPQDDFVFKLYDELRAAIEKVRLNALALCCALFFEYGGEYLRLDGVEQCIRAALSCDQLAPIVVREAQRDKWQILMPHIDYIISDSNLLTMTICIVAKAYTCTEADRIFCRQLLNRCEPDLRAGMLVRLSKISVAAIKDLIITEVLDAVDELVAVISVTVLTETSKDLTSGYVVTGSVLEQVPIEFLDEVRPKRGGFYKTVSEVFSVEVRDEVRPKREGFHKTVSEVFPDRDKTADTKREGDDSVQWWRNMEGVEKRKEERERQAANRRAALEIIESCASVSALVVGQVKALIERLTIEMPETPEFFADRSAVSQPSR
jgi:hypothetical protein